MKKLNFGCGTDIRKGYINVDRVLLSGVDKVFNFDKFPYPFKDNEFDEVLCNHVLCLLDDIVKVFSELHRICKHGAMIKVYDVYYNCSGVHNDPYLKRSFNINSLNFLDKQYETGFYIKEDFKIVTSRIIPTRLGILFPYVIRKIIGTILGEINRNVYFEVRVIKEASQ